MQFQVDADEGAVIRGWLIPDNPSYSGTLVVRIQGRDDIEVRADHFRPDIKEVGIHPTGLVGFAITENDVPGLPEIASIAIIESETKVLIYRRFNITEHVQKKLAFFNQSVFPNTRMLNELMSHFTNAHSFVERYPLETMLYIIRASYSDSILVTGRLSFNRYSAWMRDMGFTFAALLKDPFEDLAERLLLLNHLQKTENATLLPTFGTGIIPYGGLAQKLDLENTRQMAMVFRGAGDAERKALKNPLTRMLGCDIDEEAERRHVSVALENLASMDVVGISPRYDEFRGTLAAVLEKDVLQDTKVLTFESVAVLSERLSQIPIVIDLLEHDLALYSFAREAVENALDKDLQSAD